LSPSVSSPWSRGDPAAANLGQTALGDPTIVRAFDHEYGLDRPLVVQYGSMSAPPARQPGQSQLTQRSVATDLAQYFPATLELALAAIVVASVLGVALGTVAAFFTTGCRTAWSASSPWLASRSRTFGSG